MKQLIRERHHIPARRILQARKAWDAGRSIALIRQLLGYKTDGGAYRFADASGWKPRSQALQARLKGNRRGGPPPTQDEVQPMPRQATPERRCGRCRGYTCSDPCQRCGEPRRAQRSA